MWLTVASAVNGLAAYAFAVIGTRYLGVDEFADVSVAWSFWALTSAVISLPIQHWMTWRAESDSDLGGLVRARHRLVLIGLVAGGLLGVVALEPRFFSAPRSWALLVVGLGIGSWMLGWGRGVLAAKGDYRRVALVIGGENTIRLAALGAVVGFGGDPLWVASALLAGPVILLLVWRHLFLSGQPLARPVPVVRSVLALGGAMAIAQAILHLGPAAAAWLDQPANTITATFSTFAVFRAPILVLLALSSRVTAPITRLVADRSVERLRLLLTRSGLFTLVLAGAAAAFGSSVGPPIIEAFFGPGTALKGWESGLIAAAMVLASHSLLQLLLFLSSQRSVQAGLVWIASSLLGIVFLGLIDQGTVAVTFFAVEAAAFALGAGMHMAWLGDQQRW